MPLKNCKTETEQQLSISRVLYAKNFTLTVNRKLCKGCDVCKTICPREAIELKPIPKQEGENAQAPVVDVNEEKCDYEGVCVAMCPFNAISLSIDGETRNPVVDQECFPTLVRELVINDLHCKPNCKLCEECPLEIINVIFGPLSHEEASSQNIEIKRASQKTIVKVKKDLCACCRVCEATCPVHVIQVQKFFNGSIKIYQDRCPEGCHDCFDVCPVSALSLGDDGKVYANDMFCIYCKACSNVCPKPEALEVQRTSIIHTPIKSGAWNQALEKLTSPTGVRKELRVKGSNKAVEAVKKLC